ncbi:MAG: hypothetical protein ABI623_12920 [bacterium]
MLSVSAFAQEGWYWLNPLLQGNDLHAVQMFNANEAYALAELHACLQSGNKTEIKKLVLLK